MGKSETPGRWKPRKGGKAEQRIENFLALLRAGRDIDEAAHAVGVTRQAVQKWKTARPGFRQEMLQAQLSRRPGPPVKTRFDLDNDAMELFVAYIDDEKGNDRWTTIINEYQKLHPEMVWRLMWSLARWGGMSIAEIAEREGQTFDEQIMWLLMLSGIEDGAHDPVHLPDTA